jgi:hypothetical protein
VRLSAATVDSMLSGDRRGALSREPEVLVVDSFRDDVVAGRYFPSRNTILVVRHRRTGVTDALVLHEWCHYLQYRRRCGGPGAAGRKCGYVGKHDRRFYRDLERLHRQYGTSPADARYVEEAAGYGRLYPRARWAGERWPS